MPNKKDPGRVFHFVHIFKDNVCKMLCNTLTNINQFLIYRKSSILVVLRKQKTRRDRRV